MVWQTVNAMVMKGYGVASGKCPDPRFPEGSLSLQMPLFEKEGLCVSGFHPATLNLSIAPLYYTIIEAFWRCVALKWSDAMPPENFSFFN